MSFKSVDREDILNNIKNILKKAGLPYNCIHDWEKMVDILMVPNVVSLEELDRRFSPAEIKHSCNHKWVDVGVMHSKIVCYHCDLEKK